MIEGLKTTPRDRKALLGIPEHQVPLAFSWLFSRPEEDAFSCLLSILSGFG
jgi:hypothetical protein